MLDNNAQLPLYKQMKEIIKNKIASEEYKVSDKIPTEPELRELFGVSRVTVRKAIEELVAEGYLVKKQGKGTFVSHKKVSRKIEYVSGFTDSCLQNGFVPSSIVLECKVIPASEEIARQLQIAVGEDVIFTKRKRFADKTPILLENNYFSKKDYAFLMNENLEGSLYRLLSEKYNIIPENPKETSLEIVVADEMLATDMDVAIGTPFFYMETMIADQNHKPIHVGHQYYLGDYYKFSI